jgi:hypothetical protein
MNKYLPIHTVVLGLDQLPIEMKDRMYDQDLDKLSMYGQIISHLLIEQTPY